MFDIGFSELVVIGVVALIVIGPERLPKVARTAGLLLGRLQRYLGEVKADINREMQLDELRKMQEQVEQEVRAMETSVTQEMRAVEDSLNRSITSPAGEAATAETPAAESHAPAAPAGDTAPIPANQMELGLDRAAEKTKA